MGDDMKRDLRPGDNPADALVWIEALEGEYADRKGDGCLRDEYGNMCCLAVLADLRGELGGDVYYGDPFPIEPEGGSCDSRHAGAYAGMTGEVQELLAGINDIADTFAPVIAKIRELFVPADYTPEATQ